MIPTWNVKHITYERCDRVEHQTNDKYICLEEKTDDWIKHILTAATEGRTGYKPYDTLKKTEIHEDNQVLRSHVAYLRKEAGARMATFWTEFPFNSDPEMQP